MLILYPYVPFPYWEIKREYVQGFSEYDDLRPYYEQKQDVPPTLRTPLLDTKLMDTTSHPFKFKHERALMKDSLLVAIKMSVTRVTTSMLPTKDSKTKRGSKHYSGCLDRSIGFKI
jgi:hypothetical protein